MPKDAKGHGSNPRGYRGKHPTRIKTVHGAGVGTAHAVTNSGDRYRIRAADNADQYMYLRSGKDIKDYPKAERLPANDEQAASQLASGPKSAPAPVHDAMKSPLAMDDHEFIPMLGNAQARGESWAKGVKYYDTRRRKKFGD